MPNLMIGRARALKALGHTPHIIDLIELQKKSSTLGPQKALDELTANIRAFAPDAFFFYGATALIPIAKPGGGLIPYLSVFGKPFVSFVSCSDMIHPFFLSEISLGSTSEKFFLFSYDLFHVYLLEKMGLKNCALLPLASDTTLFAPLEKQHARKLLSDNGFNVPQNPMQVSFIGNLHRTEQMLGMGQHFPNTLDNLTPLGAHKGNWQRSTYLKALANIPLHIFGQRWKEQDFIQPEWTIHDFCPYHLLPAAYSYSDITINITGPDMFDAFPTRVFDAMASGSMVISHKRNSMSELFTPGHDIVAIDTPQELREAVEYYTNHPEQRMRIAQNGVLTINEKHRWEHRMDSAIKELETRGLLA